MPTGKSLKIGIWEDDKFKGVVIFSYGANNNLPKGFGLKQIEIVELTRIALTNHITPVSKILKISLIMLQKHSPGIKVVVSYADKTNQNHHGGVYQANGWLYLGVSKAKSVIINGIKYHVRSLNAKYKHVKNYPAGWKYSDEEIKHIYCKILDKKYKLIHKTYDYPKRHSSLIKTIDDQSEDPRKLEGSGSNN